MNIKAHKKGSANMAASAAMTISGNGVVHVKASDILKSKSGVLQIIALKKIKSNLKTLRHIVA